MNNKNIRHEYEKGNSMRWCREDTSLSTEIKWIENNND